MDERSENAQDPVMSRVLILIALIFFLGVAVLVYFLWDVLIPFILGAVLAYLLNPLVELLESKDVPRTIAILLVYALLAIVVGLAGVLLYPSLMREAEQILQALPGRTGEWQKATQTALEDLQRIPVLGGLEGVLQNLVVRLQALVEDILRRTVELALGAVSSLLTLLLVPVFGFYILRDWPVVRQNVLSYLRRTRQHKTIALLQAADKALAGFVRGQLLVSVIVGVLIGLGLAFIGIRFSLVIGLVAGLFNIIPYFGPVIAVLPAAAIAWVASSEKVLWVVALFVAVNQLEGIVITPNIVGERVGLHPISVITAILIGGKVGGIVGMLLAVPVAAIGAAVLRFAWQEGLSGFIDNKT